MTVILINPIEVPKGEEEEVLKSWEIRDKYMRQQPGFVSAKLHKTLSPNAKFHFISYAEWESTEVFMKIINSEEFKKMLENGSNMPLMFPELYEIIRTSNYA